MRLTTVRREITDPAHGLADWVVRCAACPRAGKDRPAEVTFVRETPGRAAASMAYAASMAAVHVSQHHEKLHARLDTHRPGWDTARDETGTDTDAYGTWRKNERPVAHQSAHQKRVDRRRIPPH